jgi:hypothetical protein
LIEISGLIGMKKKKKKKKMRRQNPIGDEGTKERERVRG